MCDRECLCKSCMSAITSNGDGCCGCLDAFLSDCRYGGIIECNKYKKYPSLISRIFKSIFNKFTGGKH